MHLIIPMSGKGDRFRAAGYTHPKPLIRVDNMPMIKHVMSLFPGVTNVTFICCEEDLRETQMESVLREICPFARIVPIERHKRGPVFSITKAFDVIDDDEPIIVSYCDYSGDWNFSQFLAEAKDFDGMVVCYKGFHPHSLGSDNYAYCREQDGVLLEIREKAPFTDDRMSEYASNGTYYFKSGALVKRYFKELIDADIHVRGEYYVSLVYNLMTRDGLRTKIFEIDKMLQFGTPSDLREYQGWSNYFADRNMTLILPMGGRGSRFKGYDLPKPFIPVDGVPMFVKAVQCLPEHKRSVFISLREHRAKSHIERFFPGATVCEIDGVTDGQATTCEIGIRQAGIDEDSPILISACDNSAVYNCREFLRLVRDTSNDVIVWSFTNHPTSRRQPDMYAWLDVDADGYIHDVSCKKYVPGRRHAIIGTMYFRKARYFLEGLKANREQGIKTNNEHYVDDVLNVNIKQGLRVRNFTVSNYLCFGTPPDLQTYNYWKEHFEQNNN